MNPLNIADAKAAVAARLAAGAKLNASAYATAELDQLRSDCENETKWAAHYLAQSIADKSRAEKAEAELAAAKERLRSEAMDDYASIKDLQRELATEREKVRVLREALENLRDEQNGAPLYTREEEWKQAMDKADAALAATEGAK